MHGKALWEALSYPPKTLKLRLARDTIPGGELLQVVRNAPITRTRVVQMTRMRKRKSEQWRRHKFFWQDREGVGEQANTHYDIGHDEK